MKKKIITLIILCSLFILDLILIVTSNISFFDDAVYNLIISFKSDMLTEIFKIVSFLASMKFIIVTTLMILIYEIITKKIKFMLVPMASLCSFLINNGIKFLVKRARPSGIAMVSETFYSFPSGHAMISVLFYGTFIYLINDMGINYRKIISVLLSIFIIFIGISRIYLGVHYASDIVGGYLLSGVILLTLIILRERRLRSKV